MGSLIILHDHFEIFHDIFNQVTWWVPTQFLRNICLTTAFLKKKNIKQPNNLKVMNRFYQTFTLLPTFKKRVNKEGKKPGAGKKKR